MGGWRMSVATSRPYVSSALTYHNPLAFHGPVQGQLCSKRDLRGSLNRLPIANVTVSTVSRAMRLL
jgi:hypothetical protein